MLIGQLPIKTFGATHPKRLSLILISEMRFARSCVGQVTAPITDLTLEPLTPFPSSNDVIGLRLC